MQVAATPSVEKTALAIIEQTLYLIESCRETRNLRIQYKKEDVMKKTEFHVQDWATEQSSDEKKLRYD